MGFAKIILAAGSAPDGRAASLAQFVLTRRGLRADVVREWAIAEAHAACWGTPVGSYEFAVIGEPALRELPAQARAFVLTDTPENRKRSDYRNLVGVNYPATVKALLPAFLERLSDGAGAEYLRVGGGKLNLDEVEKPAPPPPKPAPAAKKPAPAAKPRPRPRPKPGPKPGPSVADLVERAIGFGRRLIGTPYGHGWREGTWPDGAPLYARCDPKAHTVEYLRSHELICSALINVIRAHVAGLPAVGRNQGDPYPGGTAAIGRTLVRMRGCRPYPPVENTPRGWLVFSPYLGAALPLQGHVGIALGNGRVLEARVPAVSENRTENEGSQHLVAFGGRPYATIIPPELWLKV